MTLRPGGWGQRSRQQLPLLPYNERRDAREQFKGMDGASWFLGKERPRDTERNEPEEPFRNP